MAAAEKAPGAFRTIGEVSRETGIAQHVLRYWEQRFSSLRPVQRAGGRRYYRPEDVALVRRIEEMLGRGGLTIAGVQARLAAEGKTPPLDPLADLRAVRDALAAALRADGGGRPG